MFGQTYFPIKFQSTLPREERRLKTLSPSATLDFNPRSHERSDCTARLEERNSRNFNPRSHERSDSTDHTADRKHHNFNPRSHERSDVCQNKGLSNPFISIHAPTRGATIRTQNKVWNFRISIHAPTRGATAILHKKFVYFYTIPTINI